MTFTGQSILTRSESASYELVAGEAILIDVTTGTYFSLNTVGTDFWELIDGEKSIADHAAVIAAKYEVDVPMVLADLLELTGEMAKDGLVS